MCIAVLIELYTKHESFEKMEKNCLPIEKRSKDK